MCCMPIQIGSKAPLFTLPDDSKNMVSLEDQRGHPVVLLFFPAAFTSTCTEELCIIRDDINFYQDLDARVFGISVDMPYSLAKFKETHGYNIPLLSDFNKEVVQAYDTMYENWSMGMKGVAKRSAFVLDREGIVRYAEVLEDAGKLPDINAIKEALSLLN